VAIYAREWPPLAHKLRNLALELERLQGDINQANSELLRAGDPRQIDEIDRVARPTDPTQPMHGTELWRALRLPSTVAADKMFFPTTDAWGTPLPEVARPPR
jgi:hypothetical protein